MRTAFAVSFLLAVVSAAPLAAAPARTHGTSVVLHAAVDPADSLYRLARAALNDGDYRRAATLFATVADRYPDSEYAPDALYYRAFALYRLGTGRELEAAVVALDRQAARYPKAATLGDAKQLRASIRSLQATHGDAPADEEIKRGAQALSNEKRCPDDDDEMRLTALRYLVQQDPDQLLPVLQKVIDRKDSCSVKLRRQAIYLLAQTKEEERADILLRVASSDPSIDVRRDAVQWLSQVNTERAARALDSILFTTTDADLRDKTLYALSRHRSPVARQALHRFAELTSAPTDLRVRAVYYLGQTRGGDDSEYLRSLYGKTVSPEIREAIIQAVANQNTPDRTSWLLGIARDRKQEIETRKRALYYAGQRGLELKDLLALYDELAGQSDMQEQLLYVIGQRKDTEATDKLIAVARTEKNPDLRKRAISLLGQRRDPRVKQFLVELINQ